LTTGRRYVKKIKGGVNSFPPFIFQNNYEGHMADISEKDFLRFQEKYFATVGHSAGRERHMISLYTDTVKLSRLLIKLYNHTIGEMELDQSEFSEIAQEVEVLKGNINFRSLKKPIKVCLRQIV
jgi:hypothetical protein